MALMRCPVCGLPLTDAEAQLTNCAVCGGALAPTPTAPQAPAAPARTGHQSRRRLIAWLAVGAGGMAVLLLAACLIGKWPWGARQPESGNFSATPGAPIAKKEAVGPIASRPAAKPATDSDVESARAEVIYPPQAAAQAKAPGDAVTDGDTGARAKPAGVARQQDQAPQVAADRPPDLLAPQLPGPLAQMPGIAGREFPGVLGPRGIADNEIDELLRMAAARQQELEKLLNQAGMQDLDLLGAARAIQGFGKVQGLGGRRPVFPPIGGVPQPQKAGPGDVGELTLTGNAISDRDLDSLRGLMTLRVLSLAGTSITDAGMEVLKGLKGLRRLNLSGTQVTDRGLEQLHGMTELRELNLTNSRVSDKGVLRLQQLLPDVEITR
jgi:hypothetical protein